MRTIKLIVGSLLIAFPITYIGTFLLTPVYWKLEPILGIELAGHSGPSDWVFEVNLVVIAAVIFLFLKFVFRTRDATNSRKDVPQ
jgi:hypothetical protein